MSGLFCVHSRYPPSLESWLCALHPSPWCFVPRQRWSGAPLRLCRCCCLVRGIAAAWLAVCLHLWDVKSVPQSSGWWECPVCELVWKQALVWQECREVVLHHWVLSSTQLPYVKKHRCNGIYGDPALLCFHLEEPRACLCCITVLLSL